LPLLVKTAISQVEAGADIIAPSNMMDGFVVEIRRGLDEAGYYNIPIMSYGVKYASSFFGPFRDAADSAPSFGPSIILLGAIISAPASTCEIAVLTSSGNDLSLSTLKFVVD
jgi:delta-aminolevulinic acid dehydratase/porphobilinogen synthase